MPESISLNLQFHHPVRGQMLFHTVFWTSFDHCNPSSTFRSSPTESLMSGSANSCEHTAIQPWQSTEPLSGGARFCPLISIGYLHMVSPIEIGKIFPTVPTIRYILLTYLPLPLRSSPDHPSSRFVHCSVHPDPRRGPSPGRSSTPQRSSRRVVRSPRG